jgi:fused signal recognition particle receptor
MFFRKKDALKTESKPGILERMKRALGATKTSLVNRIESVLSGRTAIDEQTLDELEGALLSADLGFRAVDRIMECVRRERAEGKLHTADEVRNSMRAQLLSILQTRKGPLPADAEVPGPEVWMVVGVNGTGKTTTVGKIAARVAQEGRKVLVCAADTFRPAAIEQLAVWAERSGTELVKSRTGADPSSVLHDALSSAVARQTDVVIVDTAGRLHTKSNLMQELEKMRRVAGRLVAGAPHEVLLVIDATTGQNGLSQAREFLKATGVTGLIVTKLDGTAKGGVVFGICHELGIPVRYIGVGESLDDLLDFSPPDFVDSLFGSAGKPASAA